MVCTTRLITAAPRRERRRTSTARRSPTVTSDTSVSEGGRSPYAGAAASTIRRGPSAGKYSEGAGRLG